MKTTILILLSVLFANIGFAQTNVLNISNISNGYTISFTMPTYTVQDTSLVDLFNNAGVYKFIKVDNFGYIDEVGYPRLPQLSFDLPVPTSSSNYAVTISNQTISEITLDKQMLPTQTDLTDVTEKPSLQLDQAYYSSTGDLYNFKWKLSGPYIVSEQKGLTMSIFPFTYNPSTNKIQVLKQATFTFTCTSTSQSANAGYTSKVREEYLSSFFGNSFSNIQNGSLYLRSSSSQAQSAGRYLMITAPDYVSTLTPFANYKRNLGYDVTVVSTSTTGTTASAIKSYIQNQYNNTATRPDFVLLVGDVDKIPASAGNASGADTGNPITDLMYACTAGDDLKADISLGRFSVSSTGELANIIRKTTYMEMNMHNFAKKAKFIAGKDRDCNQIIPIFCNYQKNYMEWCFEFPSLYVMANTFYPLGYNYQMLKQPNLTQVYAAINDNPLFFVYSGHGYFTYIAGNSFSLYGSDLNNNSNTVFPFVFSFACITGNYAYSDPCIGEIFIRNAKGGVTYFGSSINTNTESDRIIEMKILGDAFTEKENIGVITNLGMKRFKNWFWSWLTGSDKYIKSYNLLGDPSLNINGVRVMQVPTISGQGTVTLTNPNSIPVTWSITGSYTLSSPTNTSVVVTRTGTTAGSITAQFQGLGSVAENIFFSPCVNDYTGQTVTANTTINGCTNLNVQNITVGNNAKLTLSAPGEVNINGSFEIQSGSQLDVKSP